MNQRRVFRVQVIVISVRYHQHVMHVLLQWFYEKTSFAILHVPAGTLFKQLVSVANVLIHENHELEMITVNENSVFLD